MSEVWNAWDFRDPATTASAESLVGYTVVATDGEVGRVVEATTDAGTSSLVVGREAQPDLHVMLPAGVVERIDDDGRRVYVGRTRREIEGAPAPTADPDDPKYRDLLADYYGGYYWTGPSDAVSQETRREATDTE